MFDEPPLQRQTGGCLMMRAAPGHVSWQELVLQLGLRVFAHMRNSGQPRREGTVWLGKAQRGQLIGALGRTVLCFTTGPSHSEHVATLSAGRQALNSRADSSNSQ